ncbi:AI-2E family transporter [Robiginitalea sp.]|uniref:AI-2E family transporter n=1 Tax=Robiginitalea sp. TaxID=1902411 RepID=UPI003C741795
MKGINISSLIRIALLFLLLGWCFYIIRPFLIILVWAIIIAVAVFPLYHRFADRIPLKWRKPVTFLFGLLALLIVVVPTYFLVGSVVDSISLTVEQIKDNTLEIPQPDETVKSWPLIGEDLYTEWVQISDNLQNYILIHKDFVLEHITELVTGVTGFLGTFIAFIFSFMIAVVFMYHARAGYKSAVRVFQKLIGSSGEEILLMSRDTIRSVVRGILMAAIIQTLLAFIGFKAVGLPAAGLFTVLFLIVAIIQLPTILVVLPAILIVFSTTEPVYAVIFAIYGVLVSLSDNFLKPILLGKGLKTPMIIVLIGTLGGLFLHGFIGLFVGPVILAVVYQLYQYWLSSEEPV